MIGFFRKLRRKLAEQNKFLQYSRYAIGEIVLVVIGILIALQVNNWNEERKRNVKEINVYNEIKEDLLISVDEVKKDLNTHLYILSNTNSLLTHLVEKRNFVDTLVNELLLSSRDLQIFPKMSGYENLQDLGLDILSNDSTRVLITDLYQLRIPRVEGMGREQSNDMNFSRTLRPMIDKHIMVNPSSKNSGELNIVSEKIKTFKYKIKDYQALIADEELKVVLLISLHDRALKIRFHKSLVFRIETVISAIDEELKHLEN